MMGPGMMNVSASFSGMEQIQRSESTKRVAELRNRMRKAIDTLSAGVSTEDDPMADTWRIGRRREADEYKPAY